MKLGDKQKNLISLIKLIQSNKNLELECRIKDKIKQETFNSIVKKIKGIPRINDYTVTEELDIFYEYEPQKQSNIRITINGINSITKYCKTESINDIVNIYFTQKSNMIDGEKVLPVDINEYNIRFNCKKEINIQKNDTRLNKIYNDWSKLNKTFRYKKRYSFITEDNMFRFDLTLLKTSNTSVNYGPSRKLLKKDVKDYQIKHLVKPNYADNLFEWFNSLSDNDVVEMKGKKYDKYVPTTKFKNSNTFKNPLSYEIEIEYIGNKYPNNLKTEDILQNFITNIGYVIQTLQKSYFVISELEKKMVKEEYKILMDSYRFKGPMNVTLELKHIVRKNYEDYNNVLSIRRNYSVTDKADGERNLLVILKNEEGFLINRKNHIKKLNVKFLGLGGTIMDGEYLLKDKSNSNINLFMVFDIYFDKYTDVRSRQLDRTKKQKSQNDNLSRLEIMNNIFDTLVIDKDDSNNFEIRKKKFLMGNIDEYDVNVNQQITDFENQLKSLEIGSNKYNTVLQNINTLKSDTKIFSEAKKIFNKDYIYNIDGLIFTPTFLGVGQDYNKENIKFDGRWNICFKWKPPEENTIDFFVTIKKDENNKDEINYITKGSNLIAYKTLILNVGYDPRIHTKHNSCKVLNENLTFNENYSFVPFIPTNPYMDKSHICYAILDSNNNIRTEDNTIVYENSIVECKYNNLEKDGFKWNLYRVRDTLNPNDFITAKNVWNTIFYPVSEKLVLTGEDKNINVSSEVYYSKNVKRKDIKTKSLNDFHSYVKKSLIMNNSEQGISMLDLSCGRAGDLNHWIDSKLGKMVCIDLNRENIENMENGACNRVISNYEKYPSMIEDILFIWGDSSKKFEDGSAGKDALNEYYFKVIFGNTDIEKINNEKLKSFYGIGNVELFNNGFNLVSCQFSFHYFFENLDTLDGVLNNIKNSLKLGGLFIGTCLDGKKVFDLLMKTNVLEEYEKNSLLWKITKKYDTDLFEDDESSLGISIDVYMESIGKTNTEYLVNFNYLEKILTNYDLRIKEMIDFEEMFNILSKKNNNYGNALRMSDQLKKYSFLNKCFIIEKI